MGPRVRAAAAATLAAAAAAWGCGGDAFEGERSVPLAEVPAPVMAAARKALPGVTFTKANVGKLENGRQGYEIQGKARDGKIREAEVGLDGTLIGVE